MASNSNDSAERAVAADIARSDSLSARAALMSNLNQIAPAKAKRVAEVIPDHRDELCEMMNSSGLTPAAAGQIMDVPAAAVSHALAGQDTVPAKCVARLRAHLLRA